MTASEILQNSPPPADDRMIEKAISDLDTKIWEWAEALKSAHTQLRSAFAVRAAVKPATPLFDENVAGGLAAAAAAAHIASPPPMPAEWTAPPKTPAADMPAEWTGAAKAPAPQMPAWAPSHGGHGASSQSPAAKAETPDWGELGSSSARSAAAAEGAAPAAGVMSWPTPPGANAWPEQGGTSSTGAQEWPTWTPTDFSDAPAKKAEPSNPRAARAAKPQRPAPAGPSPEERAQKAAAEEALLSELEDTIARRVRLLRRLDPDTPIEKLVDKAKQGQAETSSAAPAKEDKSSSWWRRK
ncbi:MAG: hypothetical protein ABR538_04540 [Candidatus Binatia bacterium]